PSQMWPSNDQDTGDIDPGKKFIINLKENHELWDRDGLVNHQKIVKYNNQKSTPRERIRLTKKKNKCSSQKNHNKRFFVRKSKKEKEEGKETQKLSQRAVRVASEFFLQNRELREEIIQLRQEVQELQEEVQVREDFSIIKSSQESQVRQELQQQVQQLQQQLSSLQEQLQEASSRDEL
ncbi:3577_t:CDS:2, partial [Rhizophagus irregularis]